MESLGTRRIVRIGSLAVAYAALALALPALDLGLFQVRLAEALMVFCLFSKDAVFALTLGCFASNTFGQYGDIEGLIGTTTTIVMGLLLFALRNKIGIILAAFIAAVVTALTIGTYSIISSGSDGLLTNMAKMAVSEFFTVAAGGVIIKYQLMRSKRVKRFFSDSEPPKPAAETENSNT